MPRPANDPGIAFFDADSIPFDPVLRFRAGGEDHLLYPKLCASTEALDQMSNLALLSEGAKTEGEVYRGLMKLMCRICPSLYPKHLKSPAVAIVLWNRWHQAWNAHAAREAAEREASGADPLDLPTDAPTSEESSSGLPSSPDSSSPGISGETL